MKSIFLIAFFLFQSSSTQQPKWQCVEQCEPPQKDTIRLRAGELRERILSCEIPKLPSLIDAKGAVLVEVFINEKGDVVCLRPWSGMSILEGPATEAAKKWKFKPLLRDGQPKPYLGFIYVHVSWDVEDMEKQCPSDKRRASGNQMPEAMLLKVRRAEQALGADSPSAGFSIK